MAASERETVPQPPAATPQREEEAPARRGTPQLKGRGFAEQSALLKPSANAGAPGGTLQLKTNAGPVSGGAGSDRSYESVQNLVIEYCEQQLGVSPRKSLDVNKTAAHMRLRIEKKKDARQAALAIGAHDTTVGVVVNEVMKWLHRVRVADVKAGLRKAPASEAEVTAALAFFVTATGGAHFPIDGTMPVDPEGTATPLDLAGLADAAWTDATGKGAAWNPLVYPNTSYATWLFDQLGFAEILGEDGTQPAPGAPAAPAPTKTTEPPAKTPTPTPTDTPVKAPTEPPAKAPTETPAPAEGGDGKKKEERKVLSWSQGKEPAGKPIASGEVTLGGLSQEVKDALPPGLDVTLLEWRLYRTGDDFQAAVRGLGSDKGWALLTLKLSALIELLGPAVGSLMTAVGIKSPAERLVIHEERHELCFNLGPKSEPDKQVVGFDLQDLTARILDGNLGGLRPTRFKVVLKEGSVAYTKGGTVSDKALPPVIGGKFPADDDRVKEALGLKEKTTASVHYGDGKIGLAAGAEGKAPTFAAVIDLVAVEERIVWALEKLGAAGQRILDLFRGKKDKKPGWLSKILPKIVDGVLWFGEKAAGFGLKVAELLIKLVGHAGNLASALLSLIPDHLSFGIGDTNIDFSLPFSWPPTGFIPDLPPFDLSLGALPDALKSIVSAIGDGAKAVGKVAMQAAIKTGDALVFAFRVIVDGVTRLIVFFDPMKALAKLGGAVADFIKKLLDRKSKGDSKIAVTLKSDLILRLHDGKNQIGFGLKGLLDGVSAEDAVPVEIGYHGKESDVMYGAAGKDGAPEKAHKAGDKLTVTVPAGPSTLPVVLPAPPAIAGYFGAKGDENISFTAHLTSSQGTGIALIARYPANKPEKMLRLDIRGGDRLARLMSRFSGDDDTATTAGTDGQTAPANKKPGSSGSFRVDEPLSKDAQGLGLMYARQRADGKETLQLGVGYSVAKLIEAWSDPGVLLQPTIAHLGVDKSFHVRVGHEMPKPGWAKQKLSEIPLLGPLAAMVNAKAGANGTVYGPKDFDPESKAGLRLYVKAGEYGGEIFVSPELVQKVTSRLSRLIAAAQKGIAALGKAKSEAGGAIKIAAKIGADGLTIRHKTNDKIFVRYGWGSVLGLVTGGPDLESLIPDALSLESQNVSLALSQRAPSGEKPEGFKTLAFTALPGVFQGLLSPIGLNGDDQIVFPKPGPELIDATGRVTLTVWAGRGSQWRALTIAFPFDALLDVLVPDFVAKKLRSGRKKKDSNFHIDLVKEPVPALEVHVGKKEQKSVHVMVGWTVDKLLEIFTNLDQIVDNPLAVAPNKFAVDISRKLFRASLVVNDGWKPDGKSPADLSLLEDIFGGLKEMLGTDREIALYGDFSAERFLASVKNAVTGDGFVDVAGCYVVATKPGEPQSKMIFGARLALHRSLALKFARAIPGLGQVVRVLEGLKHLLENPEDLKHAPAAVYEMITVLPEIGKMLARIDWSTVDVGKTLLKVFMADLPSFKQAKDVARFIKAAKDAGLELPDNIDGDALNKALDNVDDGMAFAEAFAKLSEEDRKKLFAAFKKLPEGQKGEFASVEGLLAPEGGLKELQEGVKADLALAQKLEGDILAMGEAAAAAQAVKNAGGTDAAATEAFNEAMAGAKGRYEEAKAAKAKGEGAKVGDVPAVDPNAHIIGDKLSISEPYKSLLVWSEKQSSMSLSRERVLELIGKYGPMTVEQLTLALDGYTGDAAEQGFLVALLAFRSGLVESTSQLKGMTEKDLPSVIAMVRAKKQLGGMGVKIDVPKAIKANIKYHGELGWKASEVLGAVTALPEGVTTGASYKTAEFVIGVAQLQKELGGLTVDGVAGPETIKRMYEEKVHRGNPDALDKEPAYQRAVQAVMEAESKKRQRADLAKDAKKPKDPDKSSTANEDPRMLRLSEILPLFKPRIEGGKAVVDPGDVILARLKTYKFDGVYEGATWLPSVAPKIDKLQVLVANGKPHIDLRFTTNWKSVPTDAAVAPRTETLKEQFVVEPENEMVQSSIVLDSVDFAQLFQPLLRVGIAREAPAIVPVLPKGDVTYPGIDDFTIAFPERQQPWRSHPEMPPHGVHLFIFKGDVSFQMGHKSKTLYNIYKDKLYISDPGKVTDPIRIPSWFGYKSTQNVDDISVGGVSMTSVALDSSWGTAMQQGKVGFETL